MGGRGGGERCTDPENEGVVGPWVRHDCQHRTRYNLQHRRHIKMVQIRWTPLHLINSTSTLIP